jgi:L-ascorbate metabolism protein UlaG (beta-lactamase superfamily)
VGNAGWLIEADGLLIATDLDLEPAGKAAPPPVTAHELAADLDVVFITHQHTDHCNPATLTVLARESRCVFVLPRTCVGMVDGIPEDRLIVPEPRKPFDINGVHVEPIHAIHGDHSFTILTHEPTFLDGIRHNCGYVLTVGGKRFLQPGDSVLTEEHLVQGDIDVLFVSPTVHNTHIDRSLILITALEPEHVFPQHFGTYLEAPDNLFWTRGHPDELAAQLPDHLRPRFHRLALGERYTL